MNAAEEIKTVIPSSTKPRKPVKYVHSEGK